MDHPRRKSPRIPGYDYATPNYYFVTICTHDKKCIFGKPDQLNRYGKYAQEYLLKIAELNKNVLIDKYVIMPNHVHLIAIITEDDMLREIRESPLRSRSILSKLIGYIKMNASKAIRQRYGNISVWQRGYFDHAIRNQADYAALAEYIQTNPLRWELDKLYSEE